MIKLFELLPPRRDISVQTFHDHWRHPHGTMALKIGCVRRYVQNHRIDSDLLGANPTPFEGVAEVFFDSADDVAALMSLPYVQDHVLIDEERFIDRANTKYFMCEEEVIASGPHVGADVRPKTDVSGYDLDWSDNNRPNSIKLLQFVIEDGGKPWVDANDALLGHRLGALRHVRNRPIGDNPYVGMRELSWPTLTAFERGMANDSEAWVILRDRPKRSFSLLMHAERRV